MSLKLKAVNSHDLQVVAENVRTHDKEEWEIQLNLKGWPIRLLIESAISKSHFSAIAAYGNLPIAVFGVLSLGGGRGQIWAIFSEDAERREIYIPWLRFARNSLIQILMKPYQRLENLVYEKNVKSIRFLKLMGFTIEEETVQVHNEDFLKFHMNRHSAS